MSGFETISTFGVADGRRAPIHPASVAEIDAGTNPHDAAVVA
jgi:hypothetical protein